MGSKPIKTVDQELTYPEKQPAEHEIIMKILKLQMHFNFKLFEFLRDYQQQYDYSRDRLMFTGGSFGKTRTGRLLQEVNGLGIALNELISIFTGKEVFEKRDSQGRLLMYCKVCEKETPFIRVISAPYGMAETYLSGSERLVCAICKKDTIFPGDERLPKINSVFRIE